ncbi:MAG: hypothetical protein ACFB9N_10985 [Geitlerinemataceae cyanobacterium]
MNLSPLWVAALREGGHEVQHWSQVGDSRAPDRTLDLLHGSQKSGFEH